MQERYLKEQGYDHDALVAFAGIVRDGGIEHSEANLNGIPERRRDRILEVVVGRRSPGRW
jgi:hypothetical protein